MSRPQSCGYPFFEFRFPRHFVLHRERLTLTLNVPQLCRIVNAAL